MRRVRSWPRPSPKPRASITTSSRPTSTPTSSTPSLARSRSARTANGPRRVNSRRRSRTSLRTISTSSATAPKRRCYGRPSTRAETSSTRTRTRERSSRKPYPTWEAAAARRRLCSWECPASFAKNESLRESESNRAGKFCVNAVASIARAKLSTNAPMFRLSSSFVLKERIGPRIGMESCRKIFR